MISFLVPVSYGLCACANFAPFAALLADGSVVSWGHEDCGGDSSSVSSQLYDIVHIAGSFSNFAAIRSDDVVISWGKHIFSGPTRLGAISKFVGTGRGYLCVHENSSITTWPSCDYMERRMMQ